MALLRSFLTGLLAASTLLNPTLAHGDESPAALERRAQHEQYAAEKLSKCSNRLRRRDIIDHRLAKRDELVTRHLQKRGLPPNYFAGGLMKREDEKVAGESGSNTCILTPEVMVGPYYVKDMLIRKDIREGEGAPGVPLLLDLQFVDVDTCEPIPDMMIDIWHCNTTGIYSGFQNEGTLAESFSRGLQPTDEKGVMQMETSVPGWYVGRATHIHIGTHVGGKINQETSTYEGGNVTHIGQLFFPESLLEKIDQIPPYTTNKLPSSERVRNANDFIYLQAGANDYNQDMEITYLGDKLEDGVLASISIGINLKASYDINNMFGGGGGGFPGFPGGLPGNFSFPSEWLSLLPSGISFPPGGLPSGFPSGVFPFPRPTSGVASTSTDLSTTPAPASSTLPTSTAAPPKTKSTKTRKPRPTWRPKWFRPGHPGHHGHH